MKSYKFSMMVVVATIAAGVGYGAGFGLYEASARGNAMGGGLVGSTGDASANYYNPANLTECTNINVMVGVSLINPFCDVKVNGQSQLKMDAGWFPPPHVYVAAPIMKDLVFGFGTYCEYGLGTKYDNDWDLRGDTTETTIEQFTFNPNIAYKITEDWSVAFGARMSYLTFENYKTPLSTGNVMINHPIFGVIPTEQGGYIRTHLEGDDFNCGYMLATQYKVTDDLNLGLVYRSRINHHIEGELDCQHSGLGSAVAPKDGDAEAKLVLPASVTLGANYDITEKLQSGVSLTWTEWSTIDHIDFNLPKKMDGSDASYEETLSWNDAWRVGFGFEYQFTDAFSGAIGYTYDLDPSHKRYGTTMLPSGDRHIIGTGIGYKFFDNWRIDLGYSFIIMESRTRIMEAMDANTGLERDDFKMQTNNSYSHIVSATVSYTF